VPDYPDAEADACRYRREMGSLPDEIDEVALRERFSGVVRVERAGVTEVEAAYGFADRAHEIPNRTDTVFGTASGAKTFTALAVLSLVEDGTLDLTTTARSLLSDDLPLIADDVTIEHLLAHTSGIGDYLDEDQYDDLADHLLDVPVHTLVTAEDYLPILDGYPIVSPAGERFAYNNGGYVLLAILAERASGTAYHDLVRTRVTEPAGMVDTAFLRSDELPGRAAFGYLAADGLRSNILHLPVVGVGDGGIYSTLADLRAFWDALFAGRIVPEARVAEMVRPRSDWPEEEHRYGLGIHCAAEGEAVWLEGYDTGVSFVCQRWPSTGTAYTVIANWTDGAWPLVKLLDERLGG
jgi:CubicO group peptidase (beta-lactamase class C family)